MTKVLNKYSAVLTFLLIFSVLLQSCKSDSSVKYVDINKLFNGFDMKTELEKSFQKDLSVKEKQLDSLSRIFQTKNTIYKANNTKEKLVELQKIQEDLYQLDQEIKVFSEQKTNAINSQIIGQMTQYIKDYGDKNNSGLILGLNETGNVLYGSEKLEITDEVLLFINDKYQGIE